VIAAIAMPLAGVAVAGGIQAASAGSGPLLNCTQIGTNSGITFSGAGIGTSGHSGIFLNANNGGTYKTTDIPPVGGTGGVGLVGATSITITGSAQSGQSFTVAGDASATVYTVTSSVQPNAPSSNPNELQFTPAIPVEGKNGVAFKDGSVVTVQPSGTGTLANPETPYSATANTENLTLDLGGCTATSDVPGEVEPTGGITENLSGTVSNAATGLEGKPATISGNVTFPSAGSNYTSEPASTLTCTQNKYDTTNLTDFDVQYAGCVETGAFATAKSGTIAVSALVSMTVCTANEAQAIELGTGPDHPTIAQNADPLVVCDGGTASAYGGNGLDEILAAETNTTGAPDNGADGSPILAIVQISLGDPASGNPTNL